MPSGRTSGIRIPKSSKEHSDNLILKSPVEVHNMNFFFTLTIKPEFNNLTLRQQYRKSVNDALDLVIPICKSYRMACEISPKNGHLHYHGIMEIPLVEFDAQSIRMIFIDNARNKKSLGFTQIDLIKNIDDSYEYITEELTRTEAILNRDPNKAKLPVYFRNEIKYPSFNVKMLKPTKKNPHDNIRYVSLDKNTPVDPFAEMDERARNVYKHVDDVLEEAMPFIEDHRFYKFLFHNSGNNVLNV